MSTQDKMAQLHKIRERAVAGGGAQRLAQQHAKKKLSARERLDILLDPGTFEELDAFVPLGGSPTEAIEKFQAEAVVTGSGLIDGRAVFVFAQDFTVMGGSLSEAVAQKICKIMDMALKNGVPLIGLEDSGGARIQEGVFSLGGYGDIFLRNTLCSGVIPQISVIMGPCAGGAVYSPAITDFIFMVKGTGQMYITGPDVIKAVTAEEVTHEQLGGAMIHATKSGLAHFVAENDSECLAEVRRLLTFLPQNNMEDSPFVETDDRPDRAEEALLHIIPGETNKTYDMHEVIRLVADKGDFLEVHQYFARNLLVGFARLGGQAVGIVAQQPNYYAGVIDIDASVKGARFVRFCDAFNIPLVTLVDTPGFMPGTDQEHKSIICHGAKFLFAYAEATVPKIAVITRKAYGGAYIVMSSKHLRGDINYAWPTAEIAVMGAEGAVNIIHKDQIAAAHQPAEVRRKLTEEYEARFANPYVATSRGYIDDVIDPRSTRPRLIRALERLQNKADTIPPKKHGNIPL
jgi:acetyl-CoA carboxylase carboxyltransferase component